MSVQATPLAVYNHLTTTGFRPYLAHTALLHAQRVLAAFATLYLMSTLQKSFSSAPISRFITTPEHVSLSPNTVGI